MTPSPLPRTASAAGFVAASVKRTPGWLSTLWYWQIGTAADAASASAEPTRPGSAASGLKAWPSALSAWAWASPAAAGASP